VKVRYLRVAQGSSERTGANLLLEQLNLAMQGVC
jgi:hypothetical protein